MPKKKEIIRFGKFVMVGVLNTGISLAVIYVLMNIFHVNYKISNLIGYVIGVINSFFWNKHWVFQAKKSGVKREIVLFLIAFGISYLVQYFCLIIMVECFHLNKNLSQLLAMGVYTITNYTLNKFITFKI
ncbi:MAG: GtrA family protein [Candidatus Azobacteroides sp.]|jgi:putative flippase GtrA|nr:GtrA family protein [Candidatus Azobacteroides sp.]